MSPHVLVTGSGGFVGGHVVAAAGAAGGVRLRLLARAGPPPGLRPTHTFVRGDLAEPASLAGVCDGVDAVVHCASRVGGDPGELRRVNDLGTRALVEEAQRAGVRRFVYLSTAAVHGRGPFRAVRPGEVPLAPVSATSRTRAAAESHVLAASGTVLRPHLVYGAGDRWVVPGVLTLLRALGARPEGRLGRQSAVDAAALGRALLSAALAPPEHTGGVRFVNHPRPVPGEDLLTAVAETYGLFPGTAPGLPLEEARARLRGHPVALHHLELLAVDHWFEDTPVWDALGCSPGPSFAEGFPRYAARYRNAEPAPPRAPGGAQRTPDAALSLPSVSSGEKGR
ncbi:NAD-dependent epimerase/dehydratase family protein [Streptomyces sp. NPDC054756]